MTIPCTFEPFRIKTVEPIRLTSLQERQRFLAQAEHNLFRLPAQLVMIDLLTDSGTGAMSSVQWSGMMRGDESYAGSTSYFRLQETIERITGIGNILPTHQGRVAERLLVEAIIGKPPRGSGLIVPNNAHFDTTRNMIEASGAHTVNLLCSGGDDPRDASPFKGNMDVRKLEALLKERGDDVPFVMMTVTCNSNGGQPVSLENLRAVRTACDRFGKLLILDACRFAENAWLIKQREPAAGPMERTVQSIVREMFDLCDGAAMSARKDALMNCGGLLMLRDEALHRRACNLCVLTEGFQMTYGSLPGRDLEALVIGFQEAMDEAFLSSRAAMIANLAMQLNVGGVKTVQPQGGHAVYLDAEDFCPHLSRAENPGHSLACAIYEHGGIRCTRIGSAMHNQRGEPMELVRLAIPRRTYTQSHLDYVANVIVNLKSRAGEIECVKSAMPEIVPVERSEFQVADLANSKAPVLEITC